MKYTAVLQYGLYRAWSLEDGSYVFHPSTVLHAKFASEKEALAWAEGLCNLAFVRGVVLSGKRGRRSYAKVYVVSRRHA